ncbi:apoptosis-resistant E3 ubiquitin protein ligase 1 isoform X2 [Nematostella vectensis]|uniref:apoptosis-resistant E3 ubiquitin protein ligase 1 isoform X2 n=1 Tax=Nematostella vectensis TaxID=45351 RepID=UPI0020773FEC|nr:apoptosis-resistant E3 ubiquitin protein ligase 1 isoform X2 [Nematostella vectensis]
MADCRQVVSYGLFAVVVLSPIWFGWYQLDVHREKQEEKARFHRWLRENELGEFIPNLDRARIISLEMFAEMNVPKFIAKHFSWSNLLQFGTMKDKLKNGVQKIKEEQLFKWLQSKKLEQYYQTLLLEGITDVDSFQLMDYDLLNKLTNIGSKDYHLMKSAVNEARQQRSWGTRIPLSFRVGIIGYLFSGIWFLCCLLAKSLVYLAATVLVFYAGRSAIQRATQVCQQHKISLLSYLFGHYLQPRFTKVKWEWQDPQVVGETLTFLLQFYRHNYTPFTVKRTDIDIEIVHDGTPIACSLDFGGPGWQEMNRVKVTFTVRKSGDYNIAVLAMGEHITGSPFAKVFLPGPVDPAKCTIIERSSILVLQQGVYSPLLVEARDVYGNLRSISNAEDLLKYKVHIKKIGGSDSIDPELFVDSENRSNNSLHIKLEDEGIFQGTVSYDGTPVNNGELTIISLNDSEWYAVEKNIDRHCYNVWYEAALLPYPLTGSNTPPSIGNGADVARKSRKVYCYISQRNVSIKEFYMRIFPHKLHAFRVSPRTKFTLHPPNSNYEHPAFTISDGAQAPVSVVCRDRNVLVATYSRLVLLNIGGSESFKKKREFFNEKLLSHQGMKGGEVRLKINRSNLLESSYVACKNVDWLKMFNVTFEGEEGLDWGGVRREWFELLCIALFGRDSELFTRFKGDDPQAPVHPNPRRPPHLNLKYYKFAGQVVSKCIYESAISNARRQNVKAKFTRSFLAQLLGLRVNYKYLESDDKDLYRSKVQFIEENDPADLELKFTEEEYNSSGQLEKVVELIPGGRLIDVTEQNKCEYLNLMARYKLVESVQKEVDAFIQGLNELVPDNLLGMFDENELELLMCGTGHISVADMKAHHHVLAGGGQRFTKIMDWFWTIVSSLTQEELARLLQFVTGSSQLPPGGFAELSPQLQISYIATSQALPTAHTCFNQLCLPDFPSFNEMQRKLLLAVNEGCEGFGFS